jgi:hypothetical protein
MNLNELFEASVPAHIKPSDIPPAMRNRKLTMKDIEAERPKSAYRFRVGDKNFMDLGAAQDFAAGTGQKVERITEKKDRSPGKISKSEDPCWSGYHMVGKKKKNGREVPNCVPGEKGAANESAGRGHGVRVRRSGSDEAVTQS